MPALHKNRVKMTVTGTPGTGTITLNAASSGYQTFAAAYAANATVDILITDGTAWEVARDCAYTNSGTTVTRGTLEASSTGSAISLTSAAVVSVVATAETGNRLVSTAAAYISGCLPSWASNTTIDISAGTVVVAGVTVTYAGGSGLTPTVPGSGTSTIYYILIDTAGAISYTTTAPTYDTANNAFYNAGVTARCIGYYHGYFSASGKIYNFHCVEMPGLNQRKFYLADDVTLVPVSGGTGSASWTSFSWTNFLPVTAVFGLIVGAPFEAGGAAAMRSFGMHNRDLGAGVLYFRGLSYFRLYITSGTSAFTGLSQYPYQSATSYYRNEDANTTTTIVCRGSIFRV